jgi:hypothetical protein
MRLTIIHPCIGRRPGQPYIGTWQMEPLPAAVIAGLTPKGVEVKFYDDRMEAIPFDEPTDLVAISVETYTARRCYQIASDYRRRDVPVVMGGFHATLCPEEVAEYAEAVIIGEAEGLWPRVIDDFRHGRLEKIYRQPERPSLTGLKPDRTILGMSPFDAIGHSFATLATGGYSTHDASFAYFDSAAIEAVAIVFMLLAGISFSLHFAAWEARSLRAYFLNTQTRVFLSVVILLIAFVAATLYGTGARESLTDAFRIAAFEVVAVITSTGFGVADFSLWPAALPVILIFASMMGGCAGSTAGGMKVIRLVIMGKQGITQIRQLIHPRAVLPIKVDGRVVPDSVIAGVWGFFAIYVAVFAITMTVLMTDGLDPVTAFGAVAATLNNLGPGLGAVSANFADVSATAKLVLVFSMLFGRLEILTFLVLLAPSFWRG